MATTGELSRRTGMNIAMASRLRNGKRTPSLGMLANIITEFRISDEVVSMLWSEMAEAKTADEESEVFGRWIRSVLFVSPEEAAS